KSPCWAAGEMRPSTVGPSRMPEASSPKMSGNPRRRAPSPSSLATLSTTASDSRNTKTSCSRIPRSLREGQGLGRGSAAGALSRGGHSTSAHRHIGTSAHRRTGASAWPAPAESRVEVFTRTPWAREHPAPMRASPLAAAFGAAVALLLPCSVRAQQPAAQATQASQPPKAPRAKAGYAAPAAVPLPPDAIKRLKSGDLGQIKSALDDVRVSARAGSGAVPAIVELLKQGLPPAVTQSAIETLGETANDGASEVLGWYSHQRNVALRRAAIEAIGKTRGPIAIRTLRASLSDPDDKVRGLSATALGDLKAGEAVADLFVALDHKVEEAAASIGQLCAPAEGERLAGKR